VKLAEWARWFGVHPQYRWLREDRLPVTLAVCPLGTVVGEVSVGDMSGRAVVCVRVSSYDEVPV
jgi:hypothetical protein